ncbi:hypothetical protein [Streptomyces sp. WZ-12]|uniref:hypothetical protein n=1 Tax=Streptomyces sp. WZ-12 TaxID=3030210 RepID=UPI00238178D7|nr:hypothetical protein [Streptomyces sp. WZ-12]
MRWSAPGSEFGRDVHPPVLLVFHQLGPRPALRQMDKVANLTDRHWRGEWNEYGEFHDYGGCVPIVATTLEWPREYGPYGAAFWRFGREGRQPLRQAIGNPRRDANLARRRAEA